MLVALSQESPGSGRLLDPDEPGPIIEPPCPDDGEGLFENRRRAPQEKQRVAGGELGHRQRADVFQLHRGVMVFNLAGPAAQRVVFISPRRVGENDWVSTV